jgi:Tol biopolymer transport system component
VWHALAYRIEVATGQATLLSDLVMNEPLALEFSPDGTRGIYSDIVANDMTLIDFRNGATTELPRGHAPKWSPDGRRIAYTGEIYEVGEEFRYYEPLYVINADGTRVRRLTDSRVNNHAYTSAQWSKDNVHLLVNRRTFDDVSLTIPRYGLRIVDADTRALVNLPAGYAETGGWYEP